MTEAAGDVEHRRRPEQREANAVFTTMPFGRHRGQTLDTVPSDYLEWVIREGIERPHWLLDAVRDELDRRRYGRQQYGAPPREQTGVVVANAVRRWFNRLSLMHHPDRGGDDKSMQIVNQAHAILREELRL